jgi:hypothetical protein
VYLQVTLWSVNICKEFKKVKTFKGVGISFFKMLAGVGMPFFKMICTVFYLCHGKIIIKIKKEINK